MEAAGRWEAKDIAVAGAGQREDAADEGLKQVKPGGRTTPINRKNEHHVACTPLEKQTDEGGDDAERRKGVETSRRSALSKDVSPRRARGWLAGEGQTPARRGHESI